MEASFFGEMQVSFSLTTSEVPTQPGCQCLGGSHPKFNMLCVIKSLQPLGSMKVIRGTHHIPLGTHHIPLPHPLGNSLRQEQKETK